MSLAVDIGPVSGVEIGPSPMSRVILNDDSVVGADVTDGISFSHASFDPGDGGFYAFLANIMRGTVDSIRYLP